MQGYAKFRGWGRCVVPLWCGRVGDPDSGNEGLELIAACYWQCMYPSIHVPCYWQTKKSPGLWPTHIHPSVHTSWQGSMTPLFQACPVHSVSGGEMHNDHKHSSLLKRRNQICYGRNKNRKESEFTSEP